MAKKLTKTAKKTEQKLEPVTEGKPRRVQITKYTSFRLQKRIKGKQLPGAFKLFGQSLGLLGRNWKVFLGIVVVYGLLNAILVQSFSAAGNLSEAKTTLDGLFTGNWSQLTNGLTLFVYLIGVSGNTVSPTAGAYQLILSLIVSLALIWTLRQVFAKNMVRVRDGFYRGMSSLVQFVLVLFVIALQLIPFGLGLMLYNAVSNNGLAITSFEQILWALFLFMSALVSFYLICSSLFALYIVTLPDMTPMSALKSARELVRNRRFAVIRKVTFLPIALLLIAAVIMVPLLLYATPLAAWAFFIISMLLLPVMHSYMYTLYRALCE